MLRKPLRSAVTVKRDKPKRPVTDEMAADVVLDVEADADDGSETEEFDRPPRRPDEPQKPEAPKSFFERFERFTRIYASVGVGTAAILGFFQYSAANEDVKRERSLEFVQNWQEDKLIERYTHLQVFVEDKLRDTDPLPLEIDDAATEVMLTNLGYTWSSQLRSTDTPGAKKIENDIDRLTLFFSQMEICAESGLCNESVLEAYFGTEVVSFWQYFSGYAKVRQEDNYIGYGSQVSELVQRFKSLSPE